MPQELTIYQVDAFTSKPFGGNPAAVCPLEDWLDDELLQAIALENNLSETAFFTRRDPGDYDLRWFTPTTEVDLCGHATLASAYVIAEHLEPDCGPLTFHTRSGPLHVTRRGTGFTLDLPSQPGAPESTATISEALGFAPQEVRKAIKLMAVLKDEAEVRAAQPNLDLIAALPDDGLIITAEGDEVDFVSRYFAPAGGIPEDPVTGSAHCTLTPYWAERLGKTTLSARQVSQRGGELTVELRGDRVLVSGQVAPYMIGTITV